MAKNPYRFPIQTADFGSEIMALRDIIDIPPFGFTASGIYITIEPKAESNSPSTSSPALCSVWCINPVGILTSTIAANRDILARIRSNRSDKCSPEKRRSYGGL